MDEELGDDSHPRAQMLDKTGTTNEEQMSMMKPTFPRTCSLTHLLELDYWAPLSHLLYDGPSSSFDHHQTAVGSGGGADQRLQMKLDETNQFPAFPSLPSHELH